MAFQSFLASLFDRACFFSLYSAIQPTIANATKTHTPVIIHSISSLSLRTSEHSYSAQIMREAARLRAMDGDSSAGGASAGLADGLPERLAMLSLAVVEQLLGKMRPPVVEPVQGVL